MRRIFSLPLGLAVAALASPSAFAGPLTAATILQDFNAVIYGSGSTQADIEGAAVIGGNYRGATMFNNPTAGQTQPAGFGALTVYGSTSGNPINMNDGGNAYVAGTKGETINFNSGSSGPGGYIAAPTYTITDFQTPLNALSTSLSQLSATGSLPPTGNNEVISATAGSNGVAVINTTAAALGAIPSYSINLNGASTLVINVSGTSINFAANDESGTTGANDIIWNFYQATSVNLQTQIAGTVLAPTAAVTNGNQIDGDLVAASWTGNGELHDWAFTGTLPAAINVPTPTTIPVPEPASLALLAGGLALVGVIRRRRR